MTDYQLLPPLSDEDYKRLKDDIAQRGVMVPIEVDEHGNVLDGHHRKRIAEELGIGYRTISRPGLAEHEKRLHAVALKLGPPAGQATPLIRWQGSAAKRTSVDRTPSRAHCAYGP